jgi:hypothetical protein
VQEVAGDFPVSADLTGDLQTYIPVASDTAGLSAAIDLAGELHVGASSLSVAGSLGVTVDLSGHLRVGQALPETDWEFVEALTEGDLLRDMRVRLATLDGEYVVIDPAEIADLRIELNRKGGVAGMDIGLRRDSRLELGELDYRADVLITYLGREWSAFLREAPLQHDHSGMTRPVVCLGYISRLSEEHEAFRKTYVDSRLSAWRTDQGPSGSSYTFEVGAQ